MNHHKLDKYELSWLHESIRVEKKGVLVSFEG